MMDDDRIIAFFLSVAVALVEGALMLAIFRKAGFGWFWTLLGLAPLLGFSVQSYLIYHGIATPSEGVILSVPLLLLPYFILAFRRWPLAEAGAPSET